MSLRQYQRKRHFKVTPEPAGGSRRAPAPTRLRYVIHKHQARNLHYDLRLEWNGVLLSWAVPKGPSLNPAVKRLAVRVEDHPVEYADFEGLIPEGEYGAGPVVVWDRGTWVPEAPDVDAALRRGELKFTLHGEKLKGSWVLVRTRAGYPASSTRPAWLLIKHRDAYASDRDITTEMPRSALSNRTIEEIARASASAGRQTAPAAQPVPAARKRARRS